jgi:flagellar biosynthesis protein FlhB
VVSLFFDYAYQRYQLEQDLKMSKQDVKEEMRSMDGDPKIKAAPPPDRHAAPLAAAEKGSPDRRCRHHQSDSLRRRAEIRIRENACPARRRQGPGPHGPAHQGNRPRANIPLVERAPLARALYRMCDVGDEIPEQFYSAVAEILAYVYQLSRKLRKAGRQRRGLRTEREEEDGEFG